MELDIVSVDGFVRGKQALPLEAAQESGAILAGINHQLPCFHGFSFYTKGVQRDQF
jgi:hypothetical protein